MAFVTFQPASQAVMVGEGVPTVEAVWELWSGGARLSNPLSPLLSELRVSVLSQFSDESVVPEKTTAASPTAELFCPTERSDLVVSLWVRSRLCSANDAPSLLVSLLLFGENLPSSLQLWLESSLWVKTSNSSSSWKNRLQKTHKWMSCPYRKPSNTCKTTCIFWTKPLSNPPFRPVQV